MQEKIQNFLKLTILMLFFSHNIIAGPVPGVNADKVNLSPAEKKAAILEKITVISAKAKPSLSGSNNSAAYISIRNDNDEDIAILAAIAKTAQKPNASSVANNTEIHTIATDATGVSRMVPVNRLVIPANSELIMKPEGIHIMLLNLKHKLDYGDKFYVNLILANNIGIIEVEVTAGDVK